MNNQPTSILIVDDNPTNIDILRGFLSHANYRISAVTSGQKALMFVEKYPPDLILLDIMMPEMDGYEVCKRLKGGKSTQHIPVIFVTAKIAPEDIKKGFQVGAADYINKPAHEDEVLARVNNQVAIIDRHNLAQEILMKSEKMSALGHLVGGITHEVASPLGSLTLSLNFLTEAFTEIDKALQGGTLTSTQLHSFIDKASEATTIAHRNLDNALQILTSFKLVAVDQCNNAVVNIDLREYIDSIVLSLRPVLKKTQHQVKVDVASGIQLNVQPGALTQILTNLINNSLLHGFEAIENGEIRIEAEQSQGRIRLCYYDNGKGIAIQDLDKIFDEYFTTKAGKGGSGLGMTIVKKLIEAELNGSISLSSAPDQGVAIEICFPQNPPVTSNTRPLA